MQSDVVQLFAESPGRCGRAINHHRRHRWRRSRRGDADRSAMAMAAHIRYTADIVQARTPDVNGQDEIDLDRFALSTSPVSRRSMPQVNAPAPGTGNVVPAPSLHATRNGHAQPELARPHGASGTGAASARRMEGSGGMSTPRILTTLRTPGRPGRLGRRPHRPQRRLAAPCVSARLRLRPRPDALRPSRDRHQQQPDRTGKGGAQPTPTTSASQTSKSPGIRRTAADEYANWLGTQLAADDIALDIVAGNYQATFRGYVNLDMLPGRHQSLLGADLGCRPQLGPDSRPRPGRQPDHAPHPRRAHQLVLQPGPVRRGRNHRHAHHLDRVRRRLRPRSRNRA